jgi:hypothetical protein
MKKSPNLQIPAFIASAATAGYYFAKDALPGSMVYSQPGGLRMTTGCGTGPLSRNSSAWLIRDEAMQTATVNRTESNTQMSRRARRMEVATVVSLWHQQFYSITRLLA